MEQDLELDLVVVGRGVDVRAQLHHLVGEVGGARLDVVEQAAGEAAIERFLVHGYLLDSAPLGRGECTLTHHRRPAFPPYAPTLVSRRRHRRGGDGKRHEGNGEERGRPRHPTRRAVGGRAIGEAALDAAGEVREQGTDDADDGERTGGDRLQRVALGERPTASDEQQDGGDQQGQRHQRERDEAERHEDDRGRHQEHRPTGAGTDDREDTGRGDDRAEGERGSEASAFRDSGCPPTNRIAVSPSPPRITTTPVTIATRRSHRDMAPPPVRQCSARDDLIRTYE